MNHSTPERRGISSGRIRAFVEELERSRLSTHDIIIARGDDIIFENYRPPFGPDYLHRMYSVSKSFVSLAVGFAIQDGLLDLDDTMEKHFPHELEGQTDANMRRQTVRHMLMMSTAKLPQNWFSARCTDRVAYYFSNPDPVSRPSGTIFQYDSTGSFVLGALVERLAGMPFMDYLRLKLFDKLGVSKEAHCLACPGGHSWGDSAVLCTARDLLLTARFVLNGGSWKGEQLLNADYIRAAVSKQIDNSTLGADEISSQGYGYLIWKAYGQGFWFNGMGCQFALCVPEKDLILVYNGDNQGLTFASSRILDSFYRLIVSDAGDPIADDEAAYDGLVNYAASLKLAAAVGEKHSPMENLINGRRFRLDRNPMGITHMRLCFEGESGRFEYTNAQGDKVLYFGLGENLFGVFPQTGYSREVGSVGCPGNTYKCAASAAWLSPERLYLSVQIIDEYFGRLGITFGFVTDPDGRLHTGIEMVKSAEDFLGEYSGYAGGYTDGND